MSTGTERMLTSDKVEQIEKRLRDVAQGYNTGNLMRVYSQDVALLLREVKLLEDDNKQLTEKCDRLETELFNARQEVAGG